MIEAFPPGLVLVLGALLLPATRGLLRDGLILGLPLLTLWAVWAAPEVGTAIPFLTYELMPVEAGTLSRLFGTIFSLMAAGGGLFALRQSSAGELAVAYVYAGSAVGVALAGDLVTMFIFWELMAVGSTLVIWMAGQEGARRAGMRYVVVHLLGGVALMVGIIGQIAQTGSIDFAAMSLDGLYSWLILIGFLVNLAAWPFNAWLPDAYPEASPWGTVFLSAFTTKTAVYTLMVAFPGAPILIAIGLVMVFYGIIYALLENDMRRILAYSICNQVGFMVTGIGIGTELALNGAAAHAFTHIIYKGLLLMSAGAVLHQTGRRKCSDLGGLFQSMPITTICAIIGALAISSFPLTSGFVSKNMISAAAGELHMTLVYFLLAAASAGVFLHAGIKFPWFVFFQKDSGLRPPDPPMNMRLAMIAFAFLCIAIGVVPGPLYSLLPYPVDYVPYTGAHVLFYLQLLLFAGLAFFVMLPWMQRTLTVTLDTDWLYRRLLPAMGLAALKAGGGLRAGLTAAGRSLGAQAGGRLQRGFQAEGLFSRTWFISTTALWIVGLLALSLALYYF